ncbi:MAG: glycerol-3-phosphate acyltransferase [Anaerolineae bacterium]|nr:MAG: glycerol-3-phosphate acyltransferase [Anaerolineae bacterium]
MQVVTAVFILVLAYLLGSIPFGLIIVKLRTGKDIREIESGRTGGTNAMRAAGWGAGILTAVLDILKGAGAVWLARALGGGVWLEVFAPLAAICGHNYSIFLIERDEKGRIRLRGGAGGAPSAGGAFGLWPPILFIIIPLGFLIFFGIGYASVTTMSIALIATIVFAVRAALGLSPWQYILYGVFAEALLVWALRPNIQRLRNGTERLHGWRAKRKKQQSHPPTQENTPR